jgi:probable rRNA maturation factor
MHTDATRSNVTLSVTVVGEFPLPKGMTDRSLHSLGLWILEAEGASGDWQIALMLISDDVIQELHRDYMEIDSPTDVMTFPYQPLGIFADVPFTSGGDIAISMETAAVNAVEAGWDLRDELEFLVAHGILHILDWDDRDLGARAAMLARQSELLAEWHAQASGIGP